MKYVLLMYDTSNNEDRFEFKSLSDLFSFINEYTAEYLQDRQFAELKYDIICK